MEKAGDILKALFSSLKIDLEKTGAPVFSAWESIVGAEFAAHSSVKEVEKDLLIVEVDHPGWKQLLFLRKGEILHALNQRYPTLHIRDMKITLMKRKKNTPQAVQTPSHGEEGRLSGADGAMQETSNVTDLKASLERLQRSMEQRGILPPHTS
ncbi:MAG TPA: DUF721 domain-containing protein [Spirochaetia bacterium]|nr:DUF721 domain-containing protein [Spirochaetia bacterium]